MVSTRAGIVVAMIGLVGAWTACGPPATPEGERDGRCPGIGPATTWMRTGRAGETARFTVDTGIEYRSLRGRTPYAQRHAGWETNQTALSVESRGGGYCAAERIVVWRRGKECEVEHTEVPISKEECREVFACAASAVPPDGGAFTNCDAHDTVDGDAWSVELAAHDSYRGCDWVEPPACVTTDVRRMMRGGS